MDFSQWNEKRDEGQKGVVNDVIKAMNQQQIVFIYVQITSFRKEYPLNMTNSFHCL